MHRSYDDDAPLSPDTDTTATAAAEVVPGGPLGLSADGRAAILRDGDRFTALRTAGPRAVEESYTRRWGVWHRDLDLPSEEPLQDPEIRAWAAQRLEQGHLVRHHARPATSEGQEPASAGRRRVVVTGLGAITPLGVGVGELWQGLLDGRHGIRELDGPEFAGLPVRTGALVPVDLTELVPRQRARRMNRSAQLALVSALEAWQDGGLDPSGTRESGLDPERVGVSVGTIIGGAPVLVEGDRLLREKGPRSVPPLTTPMTVPSQAASQVSLGLHITGEARTVTSACASGTEAIGQAIDRIRYGHVDVALAGGTEAVVTPALMAAFASMRALSTLGVASGTTPSRPFAKDRDGFVNGEGAGFLLLEAEEHARARGARVYCEAAGWGLSADAHHVAAPDPSGAGIDRAVRRAVRDAGARLVDVVHVNAHATATVDGDLAEAVALAGVFGAGRVPVTALKGHLGHLQGAAGGVEAVAAVLTLRHGLIPPTIGCVESADGLGVDLVTGSPRALPLSGDLVLSNSFGFGGHNAVLALRRGSLGVSVG
ncbi:3-oxoacyl-[acyl-carrier-protein] synthase II [Streptomyces aurantiacus]|uniref:beta-ketoacyl-[acyl-carrier-protein] synthase family protein n=1 Tax=Streptomyces aurantiacus TaxID=47760 RepID=UPI0027902D62|nr:beta-ketoacyl-[acyl-carrier-protein] synthase family protein [Streptomyces aurantiacus]MDQ0774519.1 3-oxoacyl-[acyl-carrier-protein] synthase II [Streptomyces aurantiacus]